MEVQRDMVKFVTCFMDPAIHDARRGPFETSSFRLEFVFQEFQGLEPSQDRRPSGDFSIEVHRFLDHEKRDRCCCSSDFDAILAHTQIRDIEMVFFDLSLDSCYDEIDFGRLGFGS